MREMLNKFRYLTNNVIFPQFHSYILLSLQEIVRILISYEVEIIFHQKLQTPLISVETNDESEFFCGVLLNNKVYSSKVYNLKEFGQQSKNTVLSVNVRQ